MTIRSEVETTLRNYADRKRKSNDLSINVGEEPAFQTGEVGSAYFTEDEFAGGLNRLIFATLTFKVWAECSERETKVRYCRILRRTLCHRCARLDMYRMISKRNANIEHGISSQDLNKYQILGLEVPDPKDEDKNIIVYYERDILVVKEIKNTQANGASEANLEEEKLRKEEVVGYIIRVVDIND